MIYIYDFITSTFSTARFRCVRLFIYVCFSISFLACSTYSSSEEEQETDKNSTNNLDSANVLAADTLDIMPEKQEITEVPFKLFSIQTWGNGKDFNLSFVSLAEGYPWNDSTNRIIEEKYLNEYDPKTHNKHKINGERRTLFFEKRGIRESDTVYIYFYQKDSLIKRSIANTPLTGIISPYVSSNDFPVPEYDFMVGLDLETNTREEMMKFAHGGFAAVSSENPFVRGKSEQAIFKEVSAKFFPVDDSISMTYPKVKHFQYSNTDYDYFVRDFGDSYLSERLMVIRRKSDREIIFNRKFLSGEGTEITPILPNEVPEYYGIWTGKIFKYKPPVLIGLQSQSFGCPSVNFVDEKVPGIYIYCDNRH